MHRCSSFVITVDSDLIYQHILIKQHSCIGYASTSHEFELQINRVNVKDAVATCIKT